MIAARSFKIIAVSAGCLLASITFAPAAAMADEVSTEIRLQEVLSQHCQHCHSADVQEGSVRLDNFAAIDSASQERLLNRIEEQVFVGRMPPVDGGEFPGRQRSEVLSLIGDSFANLGTRSLFRQKMKSPGYGNYIDHDRLFRGDVNTKPFSPPRLWRTSPFVFDSVKADLGAEPKHLRQPFIVDDKQGIRDYASLLFADSAVVDVLMANAEKSAERLMQSQAVYREISEAAQPPDDASLTSAIALHFRRVVYRRPSQDELSGYLRLFRRCSLESGLSEALRVTLMAVMLHHEAVYRIEIGLGPEDEHGRRILSPTELAFAVAYALTDEPPDSELLQAATSGTLRSADDVKNQVERLLFDEAIHKPRILRFFQEFFGYGHAHKVFKDADRSGGFAYYGENYPEMYERDADFFVMKILENDTDVFRQLLTSDRYYILRRQTFRNTVYDFYQNNKDELESGTISEEKTRELLDRLDLRSWDELNRKYNLHNFNKGFNGSVQAIMQIVKECRQWKNTNDEDTLLHAMQPLYRKYPMVYDLADDELDFLLPQPYQRPNRAGLLTHPAWLIAHSLNDTTDPIRRGKWIRERLLAGTVPDLPITVDATIPEDHSKTLRERLVVTEQQECWRCHVKMNPLGLPFEIYDDFGRYRTEEELDKLPGKQGRPPTRPINATGVLDGTGDNTLDGKVKDALDLINRLASSDRVRQSIIRHAFRYFLGRNEMLTDSQTLIEADRAYLQSNGSFNAVIISLLTSDSFLYRRPATD